MPTRPIRLFLAAAFVAGLASADATLTGIVMQPNGSPLGRSTVVATNLATNASLTSESATDGTFVFSGIPAGTYKLTCERAGYHNFVKEKLEVTDGAKTMFDIQLQDDNFRFMFYGFTAAWLIVAGYIVLIALRERKLKRELGRVGRMVEQGGAKR